MANEYPTPRELCGVYFRAERDGKWQNVCFSDMTDEEMGDVASRLSEHATLSEQAAYWLSMARIMAKTLHEVGDAFGIARGDELSATEELRRMLDERGVEYEGGERSVRWRDRNGVMMQAFPLADGELGMDVWSCTPEQAIAATLGAGTCRISVQDNLAETDGIGDVWLECDECHWQMPLEPSTPRFNFCPNCGRRVVDE